MSRPTNSVAMFCTGLKLRHSKPTSAAHLEKKSGIVPQVLFEVLILVHIKITVVGDTAFAPLISVGIYHFLPPCWAHPDHPQMNTLCDKKPSTTQIEDTNPNV